MTQASLLAKKQAACREQAKKAAQEKTRPFLLNFLSYHSKDIKQKGLSLQNVKVKVANILNKNEEYDYQLSHIVKIEGSISKELIKSIICPDCGKELKHHKMWDSYICHCTGKKKVFDIFDLKLEE